MIDHISASLATKMKSFETGLQGRVSDALNNGQERGGGNEPQREDGIDPSDNRIHPENSGRIETPSPVRIRPAREFEG
jgi:hypothetical protein